MSFPHPAPLFVNGITSIWTDFKEAYDRKALIASYSTGALMSDWTAVADQPAATSEVASVAGSISGQAYHFAGSNGLGLIYALTWDYVAPVADVEILMGFKVVVQGAAFSTVWALARRVGAGGKWADLEGNSQQNLRLSATTDNVSFDNATATFNWAVGTWYWMRMNCTGNVQNVKVWPRSSAEPSSWTGTLTSSRASSAGLVGLLASLRNANEVYVDFFSVSLDGKPAYGPGL